MARPAGPPHRPALLTIVHGAAAHGAPTGDPARSYVDGDCVSDDPVLLAAYAALDPAERALLHDRRADELLALGEPSLRLGAVCYHREHGSDPAGAGVAALGDALGDCILAGHYDAVLDLGRRCLDLADWDHPGRRRAGSPP